MIVTFDSQTFRAVVEPDRHDRHPSRDALERVNRAICDKQIEPIASEGMFTLEEISRDERASFLANRRVEVETGDERLEGNQVSLTLQVGPDHSLHPGLSPESKRRFDAAISLGFRFLNIPRFLMVRPDELVRANRYLDFGGDIFEAFTDYAERFSKVADKIEQRGAGFSIAKKIGNRARARAGCTATWCELLTDPRYLNDNERREVGAAVSEWCDGDLVASHAAHGLTYICTEDHAGRKQRPSVFNRVNREWLAAEHGIKFVSLSELAVLLGA